GHPQGRWIDLGSGGGSPAIPLKIVRPQLRLTMVEARERKAAFLREAARQLAMDGVDVLNERFELLSARHPELGGRHLLVTVRAVRIDMALLQSCRWLLAPGGRLLLFGAQDAPGFEDAGFEASGRFDLSLGGSRLLVLTVGSDTA
ncbi:MAG: RsmG family class I SAM-dependent methyltransferase, partial [Acidobacteriota bacterium]